MSAINRVELAARFEMDAEWVLARLAPSFLSSTPGVLAQLRRELAAQSSRGVYEQAHKLKGNSAAVCAERMQRLAMDVEVAAHAGQFAVIERLLGQPKNWGESGVAYQSIRFSPLLRTLSA